MEMRFESLRANSDGLEAGAEKHGCAFEIVYREYAHLNILMVIA